MGSAALSIVTDHMGKASSRENVKLFEKLDALLIVIEAVPLSGGGDDQDRSRSAGKLVRSHGVPGKLQSLVH